MDLDSSALNLPGFADEGDPLQALDWAGLIARLGAERDLRRELNGRIGAIANGAASFAGGAAWALDRSRQGERGVNPDALADRKATEGISPEAPETTAPGSDARGQK